MSQQARILVVDDEPQIARVLRTGLKTHGYDVRVAADGVSALETFHDWRPDLVVTDLSMPNLDGLELCRRLREVSQLPVIVLSVRGEEKTKVEALDAGADDYVTTPFGMDELLARVRAQLRRAASTPRSDPPSAVLEAGDFRIDREARRVFVRGAEVHLTPRSTTCSPTSRRTRARSSRTTTCSARSGAATTRSRASTCGSSSASSVKRSSRTPRRRATS